MGTGEVEKDRMDKEKAFEIYNECMQMNLSQMQDVIEEAQSQEERSFYVELYNYVLKTRQEKVVADGKF